MDELNIQAWLALFAAAEAIGSAVATGVRQLAHRTLTKEENEAVLARWEDNQARAAANAGITTETND